MSEQTAIEVVKLFSGWFGQIITISSGLILVLVTFREKIFPQRSKRGWVNGLNALLMFVTFMGFILAIWGSVWGQLGIISFMPGTSAQPSTLANFQDAMRWTGYGFLAGIVGLTGIVSFNIGLGEDESPKDKSDNKKAK